MLACGCEFYLLVFNPISHLFAALSQYRVEHSKIEFISKCVHVISSIFHLSTLQVICFIGMHRNCFKLQVHVFYTSALNISWLWKMHEKGNWLIFVAIVNNVYDVNHSFLRENSPRVKNRMMLIVSLKQNTVSFHVWQNGFEARCLLKWSSVLILLNFLFEFY